MINFKYARDFGHTAKSVENLLQDFHPPSSYSLNVSSIQLTHESVQRIIELLSNNRSRLLSLDLDRTGFPATKLANALQAAAAAAGCPLRALSLRGNQYQQKDMLLLSDSIQHSNIVFLIMDRFAIKKDGSYEITDTLLPEECAVFASVRRHMRDINLSHQSVRVCGCRVLRSILQHPTCHLKSLLLSSSPIGDRGAEVLAMGLIKNNTVELHNRINTINI